MQLEEDLSFYFTWMTIHLVQNQAQVYLQRVHLLQVVELKLSHLMHKAVLLSLRK